jgi:cytochrome b561
MKLTNTPERYGAIAQLFHWIVVVLIITQFWLALTAEGQPLAQKASTLILHKSIGMTVFALAVLRLAWRLVNPVPPVPATAPRWQQLGAHASHIALYSLILITPLLGWLMSSARGFTVSWFHLITLPDLVQKNEASYKLLVTSHEVAAWTLFGVAVLHVAAALKHHFFDRDNVLRRMLP